MKRYNLYKLSKSNVINQLTDMVMEWWITKEYLETTSYKQAQDEIQNHIKILLEQMDD